MLRTYLLFGYELYNRLGSRVFSPLTQIALDGGTRQKAAAFLKNLFDDSCLLIQFGATRKTALTRALRRIDYLWGFSVHEYAWLRRHWGDLPEFLQRPKSPLPVDLTNDQELPLRERLVILGNNRNPFNNHLDVLETISSVENIHRIRFALLFSYGFYSKESTYAQTVLKKSAMLNDLEVVEEFLSPDEFKNLYRRASALVINGYRQMALGNIFTALLAGVKVYLCEKNPIYDWLLSENFIVFLVSDLAADIENDRVRLSEEQILYNVTQYRQFSEKYSRSKFLAHLNHLIETRQASKPRSHAGP